MSIKAIIFDLDDTLYDCTEQLRDAARRRAAAAMVAAGLPLTAEEAYDLQVRLASLYGPRLKVFGRVAEMYGRDNGFVDEVMRAYNSDEVGDIRPFDDVVPTLQRLRADGVKLFLVTGGVFGRQDRKIRSLGLSECFDKIVINDDERGCTTHECYIALLNEEGLEPEELISVGDRVDSELRVCNSIGMVTVQMVHGRFKDVLPASDSERPDYRITTISELPTILAVARSVSKKRGLRVVAIGGGTGLPIVLEGMKKFSRRLTAVVTVTDSGRSSGKIRRDFGILPPGDIRNCLVALSESEKLLHELFQYRFQNGSLNGMNFGNLFIAALAKVTGSFEEGVKAASEILAIHGKVLPSTLTDTHICARLTDGTVLEEEYNVRKLGKPDIDEVFLSPQNAEALQEAVEEILDSDVVIIGPGSLYTSIISNLLVRGITWAIRQTPAKKVYVCNIVTQPGQTDRFDAQRHVATVEKCLGKGVLDYVILNDNIPPADVMERYEAEGASLVYPGGDFGKARVVRADLVEDLKQKRILWEKHDLIRHDPDKLASTIVGAVFGGEDWEKEREGAVRAKAVQAARTP